MSFGDDTLDPTFAAIDAARRDKRGLDTLHGFLYRDPDNFPSGADTCEELARALDLTGRRAP